MPHDPVLEEYGIHFEHHRARIRAQQFQDFALGRVDMATDADLLHGDLLHPLPARPPGSHEGRQEKDTSQESPRNDDQRPWCTSASVSRASTARAISRFRRQMSPAPRVMITSPGRLIPITRSTRRDLSGSYVTAE